MKNDYIHMHIFQHQKMHTATSDMQDEQATSGYLHIAATKNK